MQANGKGREIIHIIKDSGAKALIVDGDVYQAELKDILLEVGCLEHIIGMGEAHSCQYRWDTAVREAAPDVTEVRIEDNDLAMLLLVR